MTSLSGKLLFVIAFIFGAIIAWFMKFPPTDSASAAGWAQAVGTIAAIAGAVGVALYQNRQAATATADREKDRVLRAYGLLQSIVYRLASATQSAAFHIQHRPSEEVELVREKRRDEFAHIVTALRELPVHVLPDYDAVSGLLDSRQLATEVSNFALQYAASPGFFGAVDTRHEPWIAFYDRAIAIREDLAKAEKHIRLDIPR
jgi:hypothetical protein